MNLHVGLRVWYRKEFYSKKKTPPLKLRLKGQLSVFVIAMR